MGIPNLEITEIQKYLGSMNKHESKSNRESNFFPNMETVVDAVIIFIKEEKVFSYQDAFENNPLDYAIQNDLISIPSGIEILNKCKNFMEEDHKKSCFECSFRRKGDPTNIAALCMNRKTYEIVFNIFLETKLPKKILLLNKVDYSYHAFETSIETKELEEISEIILEETKFSIQLFPSKDVTLLECPRIY